MDKRRKDFSTLIGIALAFGLLAWAISMSGSGKSFIDIPSVLIVVGGTFAVTMASFSIGEFFRMPAVLARSIARGGQEPRDVALFMLEMADLARKKGILALQEQLPRFAGNRFLQRGMSMLIDGVDINEVERVLRQEMHAITERHGNSASILRKMAEVAPAMGLIGTLIGLVQMLGNLQDPSKIGPAMAVALITTMYGAVLAYVLFSPLAGKLERNSAQEMLVKTLYLRSISSIGKKENPRLLEMMLNTILPPASRVVFFD